jgi:hypothetical protein
LLLSRSPDLATANYLSTGNDKPFLSLATGNVPAGDPQYPNGSGLGDTILRQDPSDPTKTKLLFGLLPQTPSFWAPGQANANGVRHPYLQTEPLRKIAGNITTRSNVFAVWMTVGFFQVTDDTVRPVKLGPEINKAVGRHVRHRMFAIVDRSHAVVPTLTTAIAAVGAGQAQTMQVGAVSGTVTALPPAGVSTTFNLQAGMQVTVDAGQPTQETVIITAVVPPAPGTPAAIVANFAQPHAVGATVSVPGTLDTLTGLMLGNPGPQTRYDPRANGAVVLHFNIIE